MEIIDTHTHFYDPSRDQGVPWPPRDNEVLYRTVLPAHFREVAAPVGVRKTVVVEASTWVDDNRWILDLASTDESIVAFVGHLDPASPTFARDLGRFAPNPLFRGIRARGIPVHRLLEPICLESLRALGEADLSVDLLAQPGDLTDVARLAGEIPTVRIVLDHIAHVPIDGGKPAPEWTSFIHRLAERRNVTCKVSRLTEAAVEQPAPTDPEYYRPTLDVLFDSLGADRLMYGSNWPVCELASDYATGFRVVDAFLEGRPAEEREWVMWKTAKGVYKYQDAPRHG